MKQFFKAFPLAIILLFCSYFNTSAFQGKVVGVSDGDTITVMHDGKGEKIRLYGVDTPEKKQDFGQRAKQFTSDMVFGKVVDIETLVQDKYGRTVGIVRVDGKCLNEELIRSGHAWFYRQYCDKSFCSSWKSLEESARNSKVGLWSQPNPIPPWEFRHPGKNSADKSLSGSNVAQGALHGNTSSRIFHASACDAYNCKNCTMLFQSRNDAISAGYKPCGKCKS